MNQLEIIKNYMKSKGECSFPESFKSAIESLESRLKDCSTCNFIPVDGEDEDSIWEKYGHCSNCCNYYENKHSEIGK